MILTKDNSTVADWELLGQAYINLIDAGLMIATTEYDDFINAIIGEQNAN